MNEGPLDNLIRMLAALPGLGPRSARRMALHLLTARETSLLPLTKALEDAAQTIRTCKTCGNLDTSDPCRVCRNPARHTGTICVIANVADLWAIERTGAYRGAYHVLGGVLSALDGIGPDDLSIASLIEKARQEETTEIILALSATVDGQSTAHYLTDRLEETNVSVTRLARGVPVGGELDYLDDGTITTALKSRSAA